MEDSNKNNRDPFDPFSEKEEVFESKNIKTSKAGRLNAKKSAVVSDVKKKKVPFFKRVARAVRSFFEREDKKRIFLALGVSLFLIAGIVVLYLSFVEPWRIESEAEKIANRPDEITNLIENRTEISEKDFENKKNFYKNELLEKIKNSEEGSEEEFLYLASLSEIYYAEKDYAKLIETEQRRLNYEDMSLPERAVILYNLLLTYEKIGDSYGVEDCLKRFYELPDDDSVLMFEGNTLTEMKAILKKRYPDA